MIKFINDHKRTILLLICVIIVIIEIIYIRSLFYKQWPLEFTIKNNSDTDLSMEMYINSEIITNDTNVFVPSNQTRKINIKDYLRINSPIIKSTYRNKVKRFSIKIESEQPDIEINFSSLPFNTSLYTHSNLYIYQYLQKQDFISNSIGVKNNDFNTFVFINGIVFL
jgi:hypothetical protein